MSLIKITHSIDTLVTCCKQAHINLYSCAYMCICICTFMCMHICIHRWYNLRAHISIPKSIPTHIDFVKKLGKHENRSLVSPPTLRSKGRIR